ncbi:hypothetical protein TNCV_4794711 [Trichonephila clavipes]|nr:hypothetical protein TNCV_4794711 [Trichonephila clavipes]
MTSRYIHCNNGEKQLKNVELFSNTKAFGDELRNFEPHFSDQDGTSFADPTPLAHADASRDVLPRGGTSQMVQAFTEIPISKNQQAKKDFYYVRFDWLVSI